MRLDLDDLGGEIVSWSSFLHLIPFNCIRNSCHFICYIAQCLLDWGYGNDSEPAISPPNRHLTVDKLMGGGVNVVLFHLSIAGSCELKTISKRLVVMENNELIKPLLNDCDDPVLADIQDIPRICSQIQEDWQVITLPCILFAICFIKIN